MTICEELEEKGMSQAMIAAAEVSRDRKVGERHRLGDRNSRKKRRRHERQVRRAATFALLCMKRNGMKLADAAARLGVSLATMRTWILEAENAEPDPAPVGRPAQSGTREDRDLLVAILFHACARIGVNALKVIVPEMSKRQIRDIKRRYVKAYRRRYKTLIHTVQWSRAGSVWAMDFTDLKFPMEGGFEKVLPIRDVASRKILAALAAYEANSGLVIDTLKWLFAIYGKPLVMKADNGPQLIAEELRKFLEAEGVFLLFSVPYYPGYNGSIEGGIGTLHTYAFYEAARKGRPDAWTIDDIENARQTANSIPRSDDWLDLAPDQAFDMRDRITDEERAAFAELHRRHAAEAEIEFAPDKDKITDATRRAIDRIALERALVDQGFLFYRWRRITPPKYARKFTGISE